MNVGTFSVSKFSAVAITLSLCTIASTGQLPASTKTKKVLDNGIELRQLTNLGWNEGFFRYSPDGSKIAFVSDKQGNADIFIVSATGGQPVRLTDSKYDDDRPVWSPDGNWLALQSNREGAKNIWIVSAQGGHARKVTPDHLSASRPSWSPDGATIAFQNVGSEVADIWTISTSGEGAHRLTNGPGKKYPFGWSPDGSFIGYNVRSASNENLFAVPVTGGEPIQITRHSDHEWYPSWAPRENRVLFCATWGDAMTEVWTANLAAGLLTQISNHLHEDYGPVWSPDGNYIVYITKREGQNELYVTPSAGGQPISLGLHEFIPVGWPQWSPDGNSIAFSTNVEREHIYSIPVTGGSPKRLMTGSEDERYPVFSPDGKDVIFTSTRLGSESDLLLWNQESGEVSALTNSYFDQNRPYWSPDGKSIAFRQSPGGSVRTNEIWVTSRADGSPKRVTDRGGVQDFIWSEGGASFVFAYDSSANYVFDIWKVDAQGGEPVPLVQTNGNEIPTDCSADGKTFLFHSNMSGQDRIYKMAVAGGKATEVKNELGGGQGARWSPDGRQIAFVSNKNPQGTYDIYLMSSEGGMARRLTNNRARESWPSWSPDGRALIYSANMGNQDIWTADIGTFLKRHITKK
jgi:Tol biopolymer transport system component